MLVQLLVSRGWNYLRVRGEYGKMHQRAREGMGTTSACAENTINP